MNSNKKLLLMGLLLTSTACNKDDSDPTPPPPVSPEFVQPDSESEQSVRPVQLFNFDWPEGLGFKLVFAKLPGLANKEPFNIGENVVEIRRREIAIWNERTQAQLNCRFESDLSRGEGSITIDGETMDANSDNLATCSWLLFWTNPIKNVDEMCASGICSEETIFEMEVIKYQVSEDSYANWIEKETGLFVKTVDWVIDSVETLDN